MLLTMAAVWVRLADGVSTQAPSRAWPEEAIDAPAAEQEEARKILDGAVCNYGDLIFPLEACVRMKTIPPGDFRSRIGCP